MKYLLALSIAILFATAAIGQPLVDPNAKFNPQTKKCVEEGIAAIEQIDINDPAYFKDASFLYGDGDIYEYKKLYLLKQIDRCKFLILCMQSQERSERVCRVMQPY